jgi:hypothetical protein
VLPNAVIVLTPIQPYCRAAEEVILTEQMPPTLTHEAFTFHLSLRKKAYK